MESLAFLVVAILLIVALSGPLVILLTSRPLRNRTHGKRGWTFARRAFATFIGIIGGFISLQLIWSDSALPPKLLALLTFSELFYAFKAEWRAAHLF